jgi:hypothetical protein
VGVKVIEHWSGGDKAANNIINHAKWLDSAAAWAERLSVAAEAVAHAFDIAKQDTPTPDEFADAQLANNKGIHPAPRTTDVRPPWNHPCHGGGLV